MAMPMVMAAWDYKMFWQRNIHEVMFNFVEESKLFFNRRCFNVCQPSLCCRCVSLVVH